MYILLIQYILVQLNNYSEAKLNTLDPTTRKALY